MRFTKMHGIGNDYVYVDCFREPMPADPSTLAQRIADRHFGVGGDGLILICPSTVAAARMRMFNADGSESEMCGNGLRCVAKFVYDHGICKQPKLEIETGRGVLAVDLEIESDLVRRVRVNMGQPLLQAAAIPVNLNGAHAEHVIDRPIEPFVRLANTENWIEKCGLDPRMTCVSMGNPHAILFCAHVAKVPLESVGPILENHPVFPRRINVHFVEVHSPSEVTMRTWERGSGVTLACGTGAAAVCVAGALTKRTGREVLAHLPGGDLELDWGLDEHVFMTGPATEVFSGEWP